MVRSVASVTPKIYLKKDSLASVRAPLSLSLIRPERRKDRICFRKDLQPGKYQRRISNGQHRRQVLVTDLYSGQFMFKQRFCLRKVFRRVGTGTKVQQHCLAVIDSKNREVVEG